MSDIHLSKRLFSVLLFLIIVLICIPEPNLDSATMRYYDNVPLQDFPTDLLVHLEEHPWEMGFLDITKAPYNAVGDGVADDSDAIQRAIDDAYATNLLVYVPSGTYLVSKQLRMYQYRASWYDDSVGFASQRKFGNFIIGSTTGDRPTFLLQDNSELTNDIDTRYDNVLFLAIYVDPTVDGFYHQARPKHYLATIKNIDIDMGNNPNNSAIMMDGAQLNTIQNVTISGEDFKAGIYTVPGAVSTVANVTVTGGQMGIVSDSYVPEALITDVRLINQSLYGIYVKDSRQSPVNFVGFYIESPLQPSPSYRAVYVDERNVAYDMINQQIRGNITLTDGVIKIHGDTGRAIENYNQHMTIRDVYIQADELILSDTKYASLSIIEGDSTAYSHISNYAFAPKYKGGRIQIDTMTYGDKLTASEWYDSITVEAPSEDVLNQHAFPQTFASWEDSDIVNIVTDYGATPYDHTDDDSDNIQQAIDDVSNPSHANFGKKVYLPRGHFRIKEQIILRRGVTLFGASKSISVLHVSPDFNVTDFKAVLETEDGDASNTIHDFAILKQDASLSRGQENHRFLSFIKIQGYNTTMLDVQFAAMEQENDNYHLAPEVFLTKDAGGRFYNIAVNTSVKQSTGGNIHYDYRRFLVKDTIHPITIYQLGTNNTEKTFVSEINNASHVSIYGLKYEEQNRLIRIKDSHDVTFIGGGGYYSIVDNFDALIELTNSSDIYIAGFFRQPMKKYYEQGGRNWIINGDERINDDQDILLYMREDATTKEMTNLLDNGGFEDGTIDWIIPETVSTWLDYEDVFRGNVSLFVNHRTDNEDAISIDVTEIIDANGPGYYYLEAFLKHAGAEGFLRTGSISLVLDTEEGVKTFTYEQTIDNFWQRVNGIVDVRYNVLNSATLEISHVQATKSFFVDHVSFSKVSTVETIAIDTSTYLNEESYTIDVTTILNQYGDRFYSLVMDIETNSNNVNVIVQVDAEENDLNWQSGVIALTSDTLLNLPVDITWGRDLYNASITINGASSFHVSSLELRRPVLYVLPEQDAAIETPICEDDTILVDGECVEETIDPPTCEDGYHLEGDQCVEDTIEPPTCEDGYHLEDDECVLDVPKEEEKTGCFGSLLPTQVVLISSIVAAAGIVLLLRKNQ